MTALDIGASIHVERVDKSKEKFSSNFYLRDTGYLYLIDFIYIILTIFRYLYSLMTDFNSEAIDKPVHDHQYLRAMNTVEMVLKISYNVFN